MSKQLKDALWWTVVFVVIAVSIAAGVRIVNWIIQGDTTNVWKTALLLVGASAAGGKAATAIQQSRQDADAQIPRELSGHHEAREEDPR